MVVHNKENVIDNLPHNCKVIGICNVSNRVAKTHDYVKIFILYSVPSLAGISMSLAFNCSTYHKYFTEEVSSRQLSGVFL